MVDRKHMVAFLCFRGDDGSLHWKKLKVCNLFSNFCVSAKDLLTISYCVFTSSHYRFRCHRERNQSLSVCVSQSRRSVWVPSHGQLCSFPTPPPSQPPPLSSWSTAAPHFFFREATALCHRFKPLLYLFMHHKWVPLLFKSMMQIHERVAFMDQSAVVFVLVSTRTRVTVNVAPGVVNVVIIVAVESQFICSLL